MRRVAVRFSKRSFLGARSADRPWAGRRGPRIECGIPSGLAEYTERLLAQPYHLSMHSAPVTPHPVTDRVRTSLAVTLRGVEELIPEDEWVRKLARSEATGTPL